ncbi:hypothetical protein, partial [Alistipes senegalensis]|uniref:hypothetical protein n=1 Tax=Alistipes senegalensis TaxID=1288121 RepID=UPI002676BC94
TAKLSVASANPRRKGGLFSHNRLRSRHSTTKGVEPQTYYIRKGSGKPAYYNKQQPYAPRDVGTPRLFRTKFTRFYPKKKAFVLYRQQK